MAFMNFNPVSPIYYIDYAGPRYSIERDPVILFIEEVIHNYLRSHNLHNWTPPVNLVVARTLNERRYYNRAFAERVIDPSTEEEALRLARGLGFDENIWLHFNDMQQAMLYMQYYLWGMYNHEMYNHNAPFFPRMFSFACYSSRIALRRYQYSLVNAVFWALYATNNSLLQCEDNLRQIRYVNNLHDNRHLYYQPGRRRQPSYVDEGIEANSSSVNESGFYADPILLFVEEFIDYFLRYHNIEGRIPVMDLEFLRRTEMRYYTDNFGVAISHFSVANLELTIRTARDWGFTDEGWLNISTVSEARNYQDYYLQKVLHVRGLIEMLSLACYSSKLAMENRRNALVNQVVSVLVGILRRKYPKGQGIGELEVWASEYYREHQNSSDEGFSSARTETALSEESNVTESSEERANSVEEQNEAEESDSRSSTEGNEANVQSASDASEEKTGDKRSEEESEVHTSEDESRSDTLEEKTHSDEKENETEGDSQFSKVGNEVKEASESESSEGKSGYESSEEASESDDSEGNRGRKASKKVRGKLTLEDESGSDTLEEDGQSDERQNETRQFSLLKSSKCSQIE